MELRKNCVKPVTPEGTQKILEQMTKTICKVKNNEIIGTGFFCRIPFINNATINALITSYKIIDDYYLNQNNKINIFIKNNELKVINLTPDRKIYSTKNFNTTIIELKHSDNINNFLELDENIFRNDIIDYYQFQSIYILQYIFSGSTSVSYGLLNQLNEINIKHTCFVESGSNGAPILNLNNNKVFGISLDSKEINNFNSGIFLKYAIEEFKNKYTNMDMNQQMPMLINPNMMMMNNINMNPNMMMNNGDFNPMMMKNNNNIFPNPNMMMNNNNFFPNNNWMMMPDMVINNNININNSPIKKMNVIFSTTKGTTNNIHVDYGTTIEQLLEKYLNRIDRPDLIGNKDIVFIYNANKLDWKDKTPVEIFFPFPNPRITVNDIANIIV